MWVWFWVRDGVDISVEVAVGMRLESKPGILGLGREA